MNEISVMENNQIMQQTFSQDMYDRYVRYIDASDATIDTYRKAVKQFLMYIAANDIKQPTREDVISWKEYLKETGHKPTTIQNYITAVKLFFKWTQQEGLYPDISKHIKGVKLDREHKRNNLSTNQVKDLFSSVDNTNALGQRDYAILTLMVTGGLRTIEVSRANVGDLQTLGDNTVLYIQGKGREERTDFIKISPKVERAIRDYLATRKDIAAEAPLFTSFSNNNKDGRMTTRTVSGIVKNYLKAAGYNSEKLTAHSLRHTAVTLSLLAGIPIDEVSQFARHKDISTTMIYDHAIEKANNHCSDAIANAVL